MRRSITRLSAATVFFLALSCTAYAQDAGDILRLSVRFRTLKNTAKLSTETSKEVEALEAKARKARDDNQYSEAYKHLLHGIALMRNQEWKPMNALVASLQLNLNKLVFDAKDLARIKISQRFTPDEPVKANINLHLNFFSLKDGFEKNVKTLYDIKPEFVAPVSFEYEIPGLPDGFYRFEVILNDGIRSPLENKRGDEFRLIGDIRIARGLGAKVDALKSRITATQASSQKRDS